MKLHTSIVSEDYKYMYGRRETEIVPFETDRTIRRTIGKNDWSNVQLLLFSEEEMLVSVSGENVYHYSGDMDQIRLELDSGVQEGLKVQSHLIGLMKDDDTYYKSDVILNSSSIYVKPAMVQQVLIGTSSSKDCKPGIYSIRVKIYHKRLFGDEVLLKEVSFEVQVVDYSLKDTSDIDFYLDLWQHNSNIARQYDVPLWSDEHFDIIEQYVASLAELGQKAITAVVSEVPWSGQGTVNDLVNDSDMYEYSMTRITRGCDGEWHYDFTALKRYIDLCMGYGITEEIEVFGLSNIWLFENQGFGKLIEGYEDGIRLRYYDEGQKVFRYIREMGDLESYIKALNSFFEDNGWSDKVRILADEPADLEVFRKKAAQLKAIAPSFKFKVAINHVEFMGEDIPGVTDYCPILNCITDRFEAFKEMKENVSGRLSYYVCCWPLYPNTFIASPLVESRLLPWIARYLNIDGFLRWNYTVWPKDPLNDIRFRYPEFPAGDTNFVYPGKDGRPVLSLRYIHLKKGIRDYQLMKDYEKMTGDEEVVSSILDSVFYKPALLEDKCNREELYSLDYEDYERHMDRLLVDLEKNSTLN